MDPINSPLIAQTIRKLKTALHELHIRNAQLVMHNDEQQFHLSFMPSKMWNTIVQAGRERSHHYERQRVDHHYLHPSGGDYIFMRSELDDKVTDKMRRCATVTSVQELTNQRRRKYRRGRISYAIG